MARSIVTSSISRRNCYGVENHCPYSSNSSARISRKSGMSPLLLGSGRPWSHTSPAPLLAHHLTCGWSHQWILLRVTILVDGFRPLYVVPIFLLSRARLSQSFRPKLPCQRGCFVSWYLMMLFFLLALSRQVEGAALQLRPTPVMAVVTPPPVPFTRIHVAYPRQLSSSATPTSGESATTITSGDSGTSTEVPTSADSSFSTSDLTTDVSVSITSDFPTSVSTLDPTTSVGISVSISISVGPSSEPTSETPSSAPSSEPTSQPPTSGPPSSEPTSQPPSSEPSSQPTSEPPTSEPTSSPSTSEPPPSSTPPSSSFSVSPTSLPPSSPPTSIPPSSIPPSSAPSTAPSPQPTSDLSSSTLSSSNTMTATTPPVSITTSSSTTLTFTSSSESFSLSSSPSEPPATSTSTDETSTSSTSVVHSHFSTMFTTIVLTSTFTNQGSTGVTTVTSIVATGTLIPNSDSTNGNIFDHNPGAIAGVVIGIVAFVALLACWLFIARRRHHLRIREAELAALSGGTSGLGRSGLGGTRTLILDDDDRDDILRNPPDSPMEERPGPVVALRGGEYSRTNSELPEHQDIESPDNPPGDAISDTSNHTHLGSSHDVGSTEQDALMGNSPRLDVAEIEPLPVARRAMSARSRASSGMSGPDPAAWLSNRDIPYVPVNTVSPQLSSPGFGQSSSEERMATMSFASRSSDMLHLLASPDVAYASGNTSGSGSHGSGSGDRMSMSVLPYAGGSGSSGNGHSAAGGSSSGHGGSSSQGHGTSSAGSHSRGVPFPEGRKSPGPSSLLPSQTQMPPTAFRPVDDDKKGRRRSFLGRSLKWRIRSGRLSDVSSTSSVSNYSTKSPTPTTPSFADGRPVGGDDPSTVTPQPHLSRGSSISRPFSATLGNLPSFAHPSFRLPGSAIPEDGVPSGSPRWPSFEVPDLPSPALTERSSQNAPEGLLDPRLGLHLGTGGVESTAAISLRDDQDYSRPIGGLVNNRMYSTTTFHTLDTRDSRPTTRRNSAESRGTGGAGAETDRAQEGS
ncbi:unnamed protein product [Somion occarium]|uniref:Transmembrane protein n=1 Tax=Somion occarium TaxID=3059160 RepID=A0ABP1DQL7_9APHY